MYNLKEFEASFSQSYGMFNPFPEDTVDFFAFLLKKQKF